MKFKEPVGVYFAHHNNEALHVESGQTITGYLNIEQVEMLGDGMSPSVSIQTQNVWECPLDRWKEVGVSPEDHLKIDGETWVVEEDPRDTVVARIRLRKPYAE